MKKKESQASASLTVKESKLFGLKTLIGSLLITLPPRWSKPCRVFQISGKHRRWKTMFTYALHYICPVFKVFLFCLVARAFALAFFSLSLLSVV